MKSFEDYYFNDKILEAKLNARQAKKKHAKMAASGAPDKWLGEDGGNDNKGNEPTHDTESKDTESKDNDKKDEKKLTAFADIFVLDDKKITGFAENDGEGKFKKLFKKSEKELKAKLTNADGKEIEYVIKKDKNGKYGVYLGSTAVSPEYTFTNEEMIKTIAGMFPKESSLEIRDFGDMAMKLGQSAALKSVNSLISSMGKAGISKATNGIFGKENVASIMKSISDVNFNDEYNILFKDYKNIKPDQFDGQSPEEVIKYVAMINAAESMHASGKLDDAQYDTLVKKENDTYEYQKDITSNGITRAVYESKYNGYMDKFTSGFEDYQEALKDPEKAKKLIDPITNQKIEYDTKFTKGMEAAAKGIGALAKGVGGILGITEDAPDIYSKMIFALIGGGKKLWKQYKKDAAIKRFKAIKKKTNKDFKKEVTDAINNDKQQGQQEEQQAADNKQK